VKRALAKLLRYLVGKPVYCLGRNTIERLANESHLETSAVDFIAASDLFLKNPYSVEIPVAAPDWKPGQATDLEKFLATDTGKVLSERLRFIAASIAVNGARDRANTVHAAGVSAGWDEAVRYLHSLSRVSGVQDTNPNAEQAPQDEASLLERLSP